MNRAKMRKRERRVVVARIVRVKLLKREVLVACARGNQLSFEGRGRNVPCKETWCRRQRLDRKSVV